MSFRELELSNIKFITHLKIKLDTILQVDPRFSKYLFQLR